MQNPCQRISESSDIHGSIPAQPAVSCILCSYPCTVACCFPFIHGHLILWPHLQCSQCLPKLSLTTSVPTSGTHPSSLKFCLNSRLLASPVCSTLWSSVHDIYMREMEFSEHDAGPGASDASLYGTLASLDQPPPSKQPLAGDTVKSRDGC